MTLWLFIIGSVGLGLAHVRGWRLLSVQTASMAPTIRPGDAILVAPIRGSVQPGEVISYRSLSNARLVISHRLLRIDKRTGWLITAGDALRKPDPPFPPRQLVGHVTAVAPHLGTLLNAVHHPVGLLFVVYLPAAIIVISEVRQLVCRYTRPLYSVRLEP